MTISLIFAMNNMIYNDDLQARASSLSELSMGLLVLSVLLCIIVAIVLGYANSFMLRLRKREFGTYLTVGMKRKNIIKLFLLENSLLCFFAIITGFFVGSLLYQGLMLLMTKLLEIDYTFSMFSMKGIFVTIAMVVCIFVISLLSSSIYLSRVTIYDLIHGEKKVNKVERKPIFSIIVTIISLVLIVYAFYGFSSHLEGVFEGDSESAMQLLYMIAILALTIITFHIGFAKCVIYVLLKSKKIRQKGTNQFILRQLSATLSANAILLGLLAFLIAFAIIATNTGFLYKAVEEENIERRYPFDVIANFEEGQEEGISFEQGQKIIEQYVPIESVLQSKVYTTNKTDFLELTSWYDEAYTDTDLYVSESTFNEILVELGKDPLRLEQQYAIYSDMAMIQEYDFSKMKIEGNGQTYHLSHTEFYLPLFVWGYFVVVVPDELIENMSLTQIAYSLDLQHQQFDVDALNEELSYQMEYNNYFIKTSDYRIKEHERLASMAFSAILIVGALYLGVVFLLLAMAILALKTLSNISEDEKKYQILYRIGVSKEVQKKTLAKQILIFFTFPMLVPLILTIPTTFTVEKFIQLLGFDNELSMVFLSITIVCVQLLIYMIYFVVTYSITKRYVLK